MSTETAELIFIPFTARGHITPMIEFAKLLLARERRISATVLLIKLPRATALAAYVDALSASPPQRIKFVDITTNDTPLASGQTRFPDPFLESHKPGVRTAVAGILSRHRRVAGFVVDAMWAAMADVAGEFGAPTYVFWTSSAAWLAVFNHIRAVHDDDDDHAESFDPNNDLTLTLPGFANPVPAIAPPAGAFDKAGMLLSLSRRVRETSGVIANTFAELEHRVLDSMMISGGGTWPSPPLYTVGPVLSLTNRDGISQRAFSGSEHCSTNDVVEWLDGQPPSSVIFLCFGSIATFGRDQVREIASALERTRFRFLWTLRCSSGASDEKPSFTSDHVDPEEALPEGFLERTAGIGRVVRWAPQAEVLAHRATGGFVSHCGWNSLLESVWFGVPVAAWPVAAMSDQRVNAFVMAKELGLATEIICAADKSRPIGGGDEAVALIGAALIEEGMRRVMEGESEGNEVRKRVREMSEKSRKAVIEGGSSYLELGRFVNDLFDHLS